MATESTILLGVVGALAGSMVFFALVVAPKVFQALPADQAGVFLRAFFPNYYLWGLLLATASAMLAFLSSAIIVPIGVYAWGSVNCFLLLWIGWLLGGVLTYAIGYTLGRPVAVRVQSLSSNR